MSITHFCVLVHHRLPALCCAFLCTGALALIIGSTTTCQFLKINYIGSSSHSPMENFDNTPIIDTISPFTKTSSHYTTSTTYSDENNNSLPSTARTAKTYSNTHDLGLFCASSIYIESSSKDIMWQLARGFTFASLFLVSFCTIASWTSTLWKPSYNSWKILSIVTIVAAVVETPIFLFFSTKPCVMDGQECMVGQGFFMLLWSIISLVSVTVVTQVFNYPEYIDVLDEWKVMKDSRRMRNRQFMTLIDTARDLEYGSGPDNNHHCQQERVDENEIQEYLINHNNIMDSNEIDVLDEGERRMKRNSSMNLFARSLIATKSLLLGNNHVKHEVFQESSDYEDEDNYKNNNNQNNNQVQTTSDVEMVLLEYDDKRNQQATMNKMKYIDTKSDSSRLLIRIGDYGNRHKEDDRVSIRSFELSLDDYSITSDGQESPDNNMVDDVDDNHPTTPERSNGDISSQDEDMDKDENDGAIVIYHVQFSPASRAATQSESPEKDQDSHNVFPTQQLTKYNDDGSDDDSNNENDYKLILGDEGGTNNKQNASANAVTGHKYSLDSILLHNKYLGDLETHQNRLLNDSGNDKEEEKAVLDNMSFYKAIEAGTNAAVDSNNYQEIEPEPVYYSSDESETSSLSSYTESALDGDSVFDGIEEAEVESSYSDSDLIQTSKYLKKKIKRLRRKVEKRKEKSIRRRSPRSSRSVCSKISLTEYTINEETDFDLEMEDYSGDDYRKGLHLYNVVTPMNDEYHSVKSSPAGIVSSFQKKPKPYFFTDDYSNDDKNGQKKKQSCCLPRVVPIVIPNDDEVGHYSDNCSLSTSARKARRQRIRMEMVKTRIRALKSPPEILRLNDSIDDTCGSDEASI